MLAITEAAGRSRLVQQCHASERGCCGTLSLTLPNEEWNRVMRSGPSQRSSFSPQLQGSTLPVRNWDATKSDAPAELLQRGFELAYFLIPDRVTAIDILTRALEKIRARSRREMKRLYWRDKHAERPVRRIARSDMDMLQWLIMFEAEQDERAQERAGSISQGAWQSVTSST